MVSLGYVIFNVEDVKASVDFYTNAFEFQQKMVTPEGDYGELDTGETTLAFVANSLAHANLDEAGGFAELDASAPPIASSVTFVTTELHAVVERAIGAGATSYVEPVDKPWGQTVSYLRDPNGILVEIATPVPGRD